MTARKYGLNYNDHYIGILFTEKMTVENCINGIKKSLTKNEILEVLLHPCSYISSINEKFINKELRDYCLSPNRFVEKEALLSSKLFNFLKLNKIDLINHNYKNLNKNIKDDVKKLNKKNVILIFDETEFYHPNLINKIIEEKNGIEVIASIIVKLKTGGVLKNYLLKNWYNIGILNLLKLSFKSVIFKLSGIIPGKNKKFFSSCKQVLKYRNIPHKEVNEIKSDYIKSWLKNFNPEIIISSNTLIFDNELLNLPSIHCINRHSSLLPVNAGILPVFRSVQFNHSHTGVIVHKMKLKIDQGRILTQFPIPIFPNDTITSLYKHCFNMSYFMIVDAIHGNYVKCKLPNIKKNYYSYPNQNDWKEYNKKSVAFS